MATRAAIKIKGYNIYLYKHYDGYPETVLPAIDQAFARITTLGREPSQITGEPDLLLAEILKCSSDLDLAGGYRLHTNRTTVEGLSFIYIVNDNLTVTYKGERNGTHKISFVASAKRA